MVRRGLSGGGWRWEERFGIGGEVLAAIGTVEAFGEYDYLCAGLGSFEDFGARMAEVCCFVGAWDLV